MLPTPADLPSEFGRYRLESVLGEGGMARVYRASKSGPMGFTTEVALKIVKRKAGKKSEFVHLLTREAVIGGFLRHPNIVATLDFDQVDGHYYIAMEYVEGTTLEALINTAKLKREPFPALLGLDIMQQVCRGLSYAHNLCDRDGKPLNIIHRDIKPGNIMVSQHGVAKVTDFGIAKASVETGVVTATNVVRGTPLYMSPEQATGRDLDYRSDLFAVGLILFEVLTGSRLFEMKDIVSTMESIARADIGDAPERVDERVPGAGEVLRRLMVLDPRQRYADAADVEAQLAPLAAALIRGGDATTSLRERLRDLTTAAGAQAPARTRTPTQPDTDNRIPVPIASLDEIEASPERARQLIDQHVDDIGPDDMETLPWNDPVIRRTSEMLPKVQPE